MDSRGQPPSRRLWTLPRGSTLIVWKTLTVTVPGWDGKNGSPTSSLFLDVLTTHGGCTALRVCLSTGMTKGVLKDGDDEEWFVPEDRTWVSRRRGRGRLVKLVVTEK